MPLAKRTVHQPLALACRGSGAAGGWRQAGRLSVIIIPATCITRWRRATAQVLERADGRRSDLAGFDARARSAAGGQFEHRAQPGVTGQAAADRWLVRGRRPTRGAAADGSGVCGHCFAIAAVYPAPVVLSAAGSGPSSLKFWRPYGVRLSDVQHQPRAFDFAPALERRALHRISVRGPEGVGQQMAAKAAAARLLFVAGHSGGAISCRNCARAGCWRGNHRISLIERRLHKLHPDRTIRAGKGLFLVVDVIRTFLIEPAGTKPAVSSRRVFLVDEVERMNEGAQNALLKTLEEPPGQTCLILVTSSAERLLPTIRSRCQRVAFGLLPPEFVARQLGQRLNLPAADAEALARLAGGRLGAACTAPGGAVGCRPGQPKYRTLGARRRASSARS